MCSFKCNGLSASISLTIIIPACHEQEATATEGMKCWQEALALLYEQ